MEQEIPQDLKPFLEPIFEKITALEKKNAQLEGQIV